VVHQRRLKLQSCAGKVGFGNASDHLITTTNHAVVQATQTATMSFAGGRLAVGVQSLLCSSWRGHDDERRADRYNARTQAQSCHPHDGVTVYVTSKMALPFPLSRPKHCKTRCDEKRFERSEAISNAEDKKIKWSIRTCMAVRGRWPRGGGGGVGGWGMFVP
jgi:hypothetical protein